MQTPELIDSIRCLLDDRASSVSAEVLANEYAKQCRELNERLSKIGLMLESGGEIQALQLAEQPPRGVDLALALSFGGETAWQEFCRNHGHEVAPLVDARTLEALLAIQDKGLASNHPLYKDYRTAISKRDDERALDLIRVIARMNPGDENAGKELKRLQRKALQAALVNLKASLDAGNEVLLAAMATVEGSGMAEDYEATPEWQQATMARTRIRRAAALQRMPEALSQAEDELKTGTWRQAAVFHGEYSNLASTFGHPEALAEALEQRSQSIQTALERHRAEAERVAKARHLVAEMEQIAEDVETRTVTPLGLTPDFAGPFLEDLTRKLRQLEGMRGEFPENSRLRVEAARSRLTQALERSNRAKRVRLVGGLVAVVIILLAGAVFGALAFRASGQVDHLVSLRSKHSSGGIREVVGRITSKESLLLGFPGLAAEVAEASQWLETMDSKQVLVTHELSTLEEKRQGEFKDLDSPELFAKLRETGSLISELPQDMAGDASSRLSILRNDGERVLTKRQEDNDRKARQLVTRWSSVLEEIDPAGPAALAGKAIDTAPQEFEPFLKFAGLEHPLLQLPASTSSMIADLDSRVSEIHKRVEAVASSLAGIKNASTPDEYRGALVALASGSFGESASAQRVADAWPDDDRIKALLVFRGDLVALKATADDNDMFKPPMPEAAVEKDREVISELASSEALNQLWELEWKDSKGELRKCLSQGELAKSGSAGWIGKLASYPKLSSLPLKFQETSISPYQGNTVVINRPTATTAMMSRLGLPKLLDDTGTQFRSSVLPLLDSVANDQNAHPLAKAFVYGRLLKLIQNHKNEDWGLHYCPGLIDDMKEFEALSMKAPLSERAWLVPGKQDVVLDWETYFSSRGQRSSFAQLRKTRAAAVETLRNPVELAGRVSADGAAWFGHSPSNQLILGVCKRGDGVGEMEVCGIVDSQGKWLAESPPIVPFSPLLTIQLTDDSQVFLLSIRQGKPDKQTNSAKP
jgi:hypothetical protein